jgi:hypothetical protein
MPKQFGDGMVVTRQRRVRRMDRAGNCEARRPHADIAPIRTNPFGGDVEASMFAGAPAQA